jgi:putative ABC transport system permease protein
MRTMRIIETTWHDLRYALRTMLSAPTFTLTIVLVIAVAIAGNSIMFTLIHAIILKPLGYPQATRLVRLFLETESHTGDGAFSLNRLTQMQSSAKSFSGIGAFLKFPVDVSLSGEGEPEALQGARVSANFLEILGVRPLLGRSFVSEDDVPHGPSVAMISASLWRRQFHSAQDVIGRTILLNATPCTIVGVLPPGFEFPFAGTDVWRVK